MRINIITLLTASLLTGCFPSNPKSEGEQYVDKEKKAELVGTWVLESVNEEEVSQEHKTRLRFNDNGVATTWLNGEERDGKWVFMDSARVIAIQQGNVGERMNLIKLSDNQLIYSITNNEQKVVLEYVREE